MCGIFGIYSRGSQAPDVTIIERMARCLAHRGPDGFSVRRLGQLAFGAGRLAIIDLAAPPGLIFNEDGRIGVAFNGEIYNYRVLRIELEKLGHHFATQTDTEVIVHGYESWGIGVLERLRGMFALALWDAAQERLLLARDRAGEKPLYYAQVGDDFLFASEIKAFREYPLFRAAVNVDAVTSYLSLGYVPAPQTMFAGVHKLFPGECLITERTNIQQKRYWRPTMDTTRPMDYTESTRRVRDMLFSAVEMRLMSDVPLGAFLSGGVDSTAIVAIMSRLLDKPVKTFTVGFDIEDGTEHDAKFNADARFATLAARHYKTEHYAITIKQDERLAEILPYLIFAMDEPIAQQSIFQTPFVAALARLNGVPVLLTGDGSDELFAGYPHFKTDRVLERYLQIPGLLRENILNPLLERLPRQFKSVRKMAQKARDTDPVKRYLHWKRMSDPARFPGLMVHPQQAQGAYDAVKSALLPMLQSPTTHHFADRIAMTGLASWLAEDSNMRVDKMTMLMSTEARAPFEDHEMIELGFSLPLEHKLRRGDFKTVLKDALVDLIPAEILNRPKWGFAPPISQWLRTTLRPLLDTYLAPDYVQAVGVFQPEAVTAVIDAHISKRQYEVWTLWPLLVFHMWHALYIDHGVQLDHQLTPAELLPHISQ